MNDRPSLYRNEGGTRNHWLTLRLKGTRSNRDAIGARVEIQADGKTQVGEVRSGGSYLSHSDMRLHFGLGAASRVDRQTWQMPLAYAATARNLACADRRQLRGTHAARIGDDQ